MDITITGPLLVELRSLIDSIVARGAVEGVEKTIQALGHYLSGHGDEIPCLRVYLENPLWQQRSGLLNEELDKDIVLRHGPIVFYTLVVPHRRKDLRAGSWHSKGNGKVPYDQFVMTKLYYTGNPNRRREDQLTLVEFVPKMVPPHQHHVAICVLHRLDHRHLIRDLSQGPAQQNLPGNQANQVDVPQHLAPVNLAPAPSGFMNGPQVSYTNIERNLPGHQANQVDVPQHLPPINLGPAAAGFMNGLQVSYTNTETVGYGPTLGNNAMAQYNSAFPANVAIYNMMAGNIEATNVGYHAPFLNSGSLYATTSLGNNSMSVGHSQALRNYVGNPTNTLAMNNGMHDMVMNARYHTSPENYAINPTNLLPNNGSMHGVMSFGNIGMLTEQNAQTDQMSWQNGSSIMFPVYSMDASMRNQNAMASDNGPVPSNFPAGAHLETNEQNNNEDGYSLFFDLEHSLIMEEPWRNDEI